MQVRFFNEWLAGGADVVTVFVSGSLEPSARKHVLKYVRWLADVGFLPLLTWEPFPPANETPREFLVDRPDTDQTDLFEDWARHLRRCYDPGPARPLIFRPAHEMNGDWYPWGTDHITPTEYRRFWTNLYRSFATAGIQTDVQWLWSPSAGERLNTLAAYYPGDTVVDLVGVDGYNFGSTMSWSSWRRPDVIFKDSFEAVRAISDKPLTVPEVGCASGQLGAKSRWIQEAFELFQLEGIELVSWFDMDKEADWAVTAKEPDRGRTVTVSANDVSRNVCPMFDYMVTRFRQRSSA